MPQPLKAGLDYLTRCYMREGLAPFLKELEQEALLYKKPFSILVMDVDHFKVFNDKFGHLTGDEVLKYFSSSLRLDLEDEENFAFRFGGDEFVVVFPLKDASATYRLASRLRQNMKKRSCIVKGRQIKVTFSGGIACFPDNARTVEELFEKADEALYYSKNHGRARVTSFGRIRYIKYFQISLLAVGLLGLFFTTGVFQRSIAPYMESLKGYEVRVNFKKRGAPAEADEVAKPLIELPRPVDRTALIPTVAEALGSAPRTPFVSKLAAPVVPPPPKAEVVTVSLLSGRTLHGEIVEETPEEITLQLQLKEGKGEMKISRAQIATIQKETE